MNHQIEMYENSAGATQIEVKFDQETVWLTNTQLVELFQSSKANISEYIRNIFLSEELNEESTVRKFRTVQREGSVITKHIGKVFKEKKLEEKSNVQILHISATIS